MKTIWKFPLELTSVQGIELPQGAWILDCQMQNAKPQLWAVVDPNAPKSLARAYIVGTGHDMPENPGEYIGTFQMLQGGSPLVFHVFVSQGQ